MSVISVMGHAVAGSMRNLIKFENGVQYSVYFSEMWSMDLWPTCKPSASPSASKLVMGEVGNWRFTAKVCRIFVIHTKFIILYNNIKLLLILAVGGASG